ncbi:MAG: YebC/PmpR family DNA-binding transcriptional regulator [Bacillota bacterium]|nr:YebC/PmpR family DNA-binding transcriptional regulator [Bacillota bacterium]
MSGHSKWATIKRHKARVDAQRGKVFTKLGRALIVATRQGGPNPDGNLRLRMAIDKAREANMPMDHIQRAIQKAAGELDGAHYDESLYEGYGPGGVAVLVEVATDNPRRSAADVRYLFSRNGGSLGEAGCVSWLFSKKGLLVLDRESRHLDEDAVTMTALEAGAEDVRDEGDSFVVVTSVSGLEPVKSAFAQNGMPVSHSELVRLPQSTVSVGGDDLERVERLVDMLEDHDDVQAVYTNHEPAGSSEPRPGTAPDRIS